MYGMVVGDVIINIILRVMTNRMRPFLQLLLDYLHWLHIVSYLDDGMLIVQRATNLLE